MISREEYESAVHMAGLLAQAAEGIDTAGALQVVSRAEAVGPLLWTTEWINGGGQNLDDARDLLTAVSALKRATSAVLERARTRAGVVAP